MRIIGFVVVPGCEILSKRNVIQAFILSVVEMTKKFLL